ncbi:hypothetical protein Q7P37_008917 [Cladosporium fusiforme]
MHATSAKRVGKAWITTGDDAIPASMDVIFEADQLMHLGSVRPTRNGSDDFDWEVIGDICIDQSFQLRADHGLVDNAASCLKAAVALRHSKQRYTCSACEDLTALVICVTPISIATKDIDTRPAFTWLCHYYCPALLDAIYTAAVCSLDDLQERLRNSADLLRWEPEPEDFDINIAHEFDDPSLDGIGAHTKLRHIPTVDRCEHHETLCGGGEMGRAFQSQERRERQQLNELIVMRQYLREKLDARQIREYKVICDPENSPIEHVRIALVVALTGGTLCRGVKLRNVARRVSEWERYFDPGLTREKRRFYEPQMNSELLWVDRGYGRKHPNRIQEIARLARRQHLEQ